MEATFKAGDKVKHLERGEVEITYGPYTNSWGAERYLVRLANGRETATDPGTLAVIPETPKFAVGDKVEHRTFGAGEVAFGPFDHHSGADTYLMRDAEGKHSLSFAEALTKVEPAPLKVGDRVRVVEDDEYARTGEFVGKVGTLKTEYDPNNRLRYLVEFGDGSGRHGDADNGTWKVASVERADENTYTHNGVTYDLSAKYTDRDNDVWTFVRFGDKVRAGLGFTPTSAYSGDSLELVVNEYGPLRKV
ncbi:phiSA1p31-related protein [Streptomyces sp. NPDC005302]|uniref:phiSA1p31-related protein n=1 Tax=Streptomyces sp. NPDC005302 TaxID=3154675 RepID=UPI00339FC7EF